jgi:hypothetical protein
MHATARAHAARTDFLMAKPPLWFQSLMWAEMLVQVPFFFVAVYAFAKCT